MLRKIKAWFTDNSPDWLFPLIAKTYWKLHPDRMDISFEFVEDEDLGKHWYMRREADDVRMHIPSRRFLYSTVVKIRPYHKFFELKEGSTVLDVGAAVGCDMLAMSKEVGEGGLVVSIEPEPLNLQYLKRNMIENNLENVRIIEKAAWSCRELLELYLSERIRLHSCLPDVGGGTRRERITVEGETLDNIASKLSIDEVELIKMNIEGAEIEALEGAEKVFKDTSKVLVGAHERDGDLTTNRIMSFLKNKGFTVSLGKFYSVPYVYARRK